MRLKAIRVTGPCSDGSYGVNVPELNLRVCGWSKVEVLERARQYRAHPERVSVPAWARARAAELLRKGVYFGAILGVRKGKRWSKRKAK
jgi:hypothetical protein